MAMAKDRQGDLLILLGRTGMSLLLFLIALSYEEAGRERLTLLLLLFSAYMGWGFIRHLLTPHALYFLIDALLLYFLEYESKFALNYFFHLLYVMLLLEAGFTLPRKSFYVAFFLITPLSLVKFFFLLFYQWNAKSISEFLFNLLAFLFIASLVHAKEVQSEERAVSQSLYQELIATYRKLKEERERAERALLIEERNRIAGEIHDRVGHQLASLIMQLEMLSMEGVRGLEQVKESARQSLAETRAAVYALSGEERGGMEAILRFLQRFQREQRIHLVMETDPLLRQHPFTQQESLLLYHILLESLTNAMKHAGAKEVFLSLQGKGNHLQFLIRNRSEKEGPIEEGFGLSTMRERIRDAGGEVAFLREGGFFQVKGEFPLAAGFADEREEAGKRGRAAEADQEK